MNLESVKKLLRDDKKYYLAWDPQSYLYLKISDNLEDVVKHSYLHTMEGYEEYVAKYNHPPKGLELDLTSEQLLQHIENDLSFFKSEDDEEIFWEYLEDSIVHLQTAIIDEELEKKWMEADIKKYKDNNEE